MRNSASESVSLAGQHVADLDARLGQSRLKARLTTGTGGLLAATAWVSAVLIGAACIVWVATAPARRRAEANAVTDEAR
jgi:hypothetical protein